MRAVALYGSPRVPGDEMVGRAAAARGLTPAEVDRLVARAGAHERPRLGCLADLRTARPAVTFYAGHLVATAPGQMVLL